MSHDAPLISHSRDPMKPSSVIRMTAVSAALLTLISCASSTQSNLRGDAGDAPALRDALAQEANMGPYWEDRATYPTGHFNPRWLYDASIEAASISKALTEGTTSSRASGNALAPDVFTPLGPRPLGSGGGIAGRTNVVIGHPTNPAVAWIGSDGGGVWKTTNCCDANTTWVNVINALVFSGSSMKSPMLTSSSTSA